MDIIFFNDGYFDMLKIAFPEKNNFKTINYLSHDSINVLPTFCTN